MPDVSTLPALLLHKAGTRLAALLRLWAGRMQGTTEGWGEIEDEMTDEDRDEVMHEKYMPWNVTDRQPYALIKHAIFDCLSGMAIALRRTDLREWDHTNEVWQWAKAIDALTAVYRDTYHRKRDEEEADAE